MPVDKKTTGSVMPEINQSRTWGSVPGEYAITTEGCACFPDEPFCGSCSYHEDGELVEPHAHRKSLISTQGEPNA